MKKKMLIVSFLLLFSFSFSLAQDVVPKEVLTIEECIEIALKNNYLVKSYYQEHRAAQKEVIGARAEFLPDINTYSGWTRYDEENFIWVEGRNPYYSRDFYNYGLSLDQSIFKGGYNWANFNFYNAGEKGARAAYKLSQQEVILKIKQDCYAVLKTKMLLEVQKDAVKRSEEQMNIAKARYDLGSASLSDYLKAKVQLGNDNLALITAENNLRLAQANLNNDLGIKLEPSVDVAAELEYKKIEFDIDQMVKQRIKIHPQIKKAESQVNQAKSGISMARSTLLPWIYLNASYSWSDGRRPRSWDDWKINDSWRIGLSVRLNLFNGFQSIAQIQKANANLKKAEENLVQEKRNLELEIKQADLAVKEAEQKIVTTEEALNAAEQDLKLTQEKYNLGAASMLELLDANVSYKTAKSNQVEALYDYNLAVAQLEKAIGK